VQSFSPSSSETQKEKGTQTELPKHSSPFTSRVHFIAVASTQSSSSSLGPCISASPDPWVLPLTASTRPCFEVLAERWERRMPRALLNFNLNSKITTFRCFWLVQFSYNFLAGIFIAPLAHPRTHSPRHPPPMTAEEGQWQGHWQRFGSRTRPAGIQPAASE